MRRPERDNVPVGHKDVLVGRVDLVRALSAGGVELQEALADLMGFQREPVLTLPPAIETAPGQPQGSQPESPAHGPVPFWHVREFKAHEPLRGDELIPDEPALPPIEPIHAPPTSLASGAEILTRLRRHSAFSEPSGCIDVDRTVASLSRGEFLRVLPRSPRKRWGQLIRVIEDRSRRLAPYWLDQDMVVTHLKGLYPESGFQLAILEEGASSPRIQRPPEHEGRYTLPDPGTIVLVLGDLGCLARQREQRDRLTQMWLEWGRRLQANSNPALAIVPCHPNRCGAELARLWTILPWEAASLTTSSFLSGKDTAELTEEVLTRLAFALRVEPQLVRAIRRTFFEGRADAGIESHVWQHEAFVSRHHEAATLDHRSMHSLLPRFFRLKKEERGRIYALVRELRRNVYPGVWCSELLALERDVDRGLLDPAELRRAAWWYEQRKRHLVTSGAVGNPAANEPTWFRRVFARLPESVNRGIAAQTLHEIEAVVRPDGEDRPAFLDPALLPPTAQPERLIALRLAGDRLVARPFLSEPGGTGHESKTAQDEPRASLLGLIRTRNGLIKIDEPDDVWEDDVAPAWAESWGRDDFGPWVDLRVEKVKQRLRWIPSGKFWMGSPEEEEGRFPDEGLRHEETIASGFWMFDTPCRQALWEAVMGENPSRFKGPDRPVESVSWDQCQEFLERLNERCDGLELKLPSEAQWEYACRAGTDTSRYREDLNEIAWYLDNSKQETHPVGEKAPNEWGLYDTLGNVFEWCQDVWTDDYNTKKTAAASAHRVIRGGSWRDVARYVRAAYRFRREPSLRGSGLGFRCAEFRAPGPVGRERHAQRARERGAGCGAPGDRDQASAAGWINLDAPGLDGVSFAALAPVRVSSDVEQVVLRTTTRPKWASAIGRDKYGLWAELTIEGKVAQPPAKRAARKKKSAPPEAPLGPVRQRLRWIPPGRFLLGSPPDEQGRYSDERPQHEVTIAEGFWMFDTPCTQALWEALMDENPSEFKSPDRPVENVSWDDCRKFVETINEKFRLEKAGLSLSLPSEAQWEYSCRAGTTTATYAGPLKTEGENNAPILDAIAWYGGNSGIDFKLSNGWDASEWPEKQFEFDKAGTHPVAGKKANLRGLYDMLGNVWEWCKDVWVEDYTEKSLAAAPADSASARRAIRGGSWDSDARVVRAASRYHGEPSDRRDDLGFRCAELRQGDVSGARQGSEAQGAEQPGDRDPTSAAVRLGADGGLSAQPN
ncbi:MAG: formylglycine-generating enzyme family protein [Isosphaerales bacterium]